ncbi:hypothetical protein MMC21_001410 [Puttea exsequens]|nr:hypothetical protein [Puttea exsequens]
MHYATALSALSGLALASAQAGVGGKLAGLPIPGTTGKLGDAAITTDNPAGVSYVATLPDTTSIRGSISATSNGNGTGVLFKVSISGLPDASLGPFLYHIHDQPVPADGNCTGTLAHLDPTVRGEIPPCDNTQPQTCQVGDLSGKHGNITTNPFTASYLDLYASTEAGLGSFLGNRSINIHTSNTTRLTCANFTLVSSSSSNSTNTTTVTSPTPSALVFTGGAATRIASFGAVAAGLLALLL